MEVHKGQCRDHEDKPIEKCAPCGLDRAIAKGAYFFGQSGVHGPYNGGSHGQDVTHRINGQGTASKAQKENPGHGQQEPDEEMPAGPGAAQEQAAEDGREKRRNGDDDAYVGCQCEGKGDVLQQVIHGYAAQSCCSEQRFLSAGIRPKDSGTHQPQGQITHDKADEQDFNRGKCFQQDLGGNKGGSPDEDGDKSGNMAGASGRVA